MLEIVTDCRLIDKDKNLISRIDARFDAEIRVSNLTQEMKDYMYAIDRLEVLPNNYIRTKYGECSIDCIATGIKTVILMMKYKDKYSYNINSCGANVLPKVFEIADKYNVCLFLRHIEIPKEIKGIDKLKFNGKIIDYSELESSLYYLEEEGVQYLW